MISDLLFSYISDRMPLEEFEKIDVFRDSLLISDEVQPGEWLFKYRGIIFAGVRTPNFQIFYLDDEKLEIKSESFTVSTYKIQTLGDPEAGLLHEFEKMLVKDKSSRVPVGFFVYSINKINDAQWLRHRRLQQALGDSKLSQIYEIRSTIMYQNSTKSKYRERKLKQIFS